MPLSETQNFRTYCSMTSLSQQLTTARYVVGNGWCCVLWVSFSSIDVSGVCPGDRKLSVSGANPAADLLLSAQDSWRRVISTGVQAGIPMPCFTTALSFYDGYRHEMLPANLIQVSLGGRGALTWLVLEAVYLRIALTNCVRSSPRLNGTTLGPTPMNSYPNQENSSTPTGQATVAVCRPLHTMPSGPVALPSLPAAGQPLWHSAPLFALVPAQRS